MYVFTMVGIDIVRIRRKKEIMRILCRHRTKANTEGEHEITTNKHVGGEIVGKGHDKGMKRERIAIAPY